MADAADSKSAGRVGSSPIFRINRLRKSLYKGFLFVIFGVRYG